MEIILILLGFQEMLYGFQNTLVSAMRLKTQLAAEFQLIILILGKICQLVCRVENKTNYYRLANKVKDGTKCELNGFDMCVNGMCKQGGCDNELGSHVALGKIF